MTIRVDLFTHSIDSGYDEWYYVTMSVAKVTVSIESDLVKQVDRLVKERVFVNRSQAVQSAIGEKLARLEKNRLARECSKLDKEEEQAFADLGLSSEVDEWPEY
jgi:Arc/MetJ-type ribon-helix-helix transcriptional regulator